jgi:hypothetical protein
MVTHNKRNNQALDQYICDCLNNRSRTSLAGNHNQHKKRWKPMLSCPANRKLNTLPHLHPAIESAATWIRPYHRRTHAHSSTALNRHQKMDHHATPAPQDNPPTTKEMREGGNETQSEWRTHLPGGTHIFRPASDRSLGTRLVRHPHNLSAMTLPNSASPTYKWNREKQGSTVKNPKEIKMCNRVVRCGNAAQNWHKHTWHDASRFVGNAILTASWTTGQASTIETTSWFMHIYVQH